jgi:GNAT superfamily N-acetyltransferase
LDPIARELADTFIDAIARFELNPQIDSIETYGTTRSTVFPNGRAGTSLTREIFLFDLGAEEALGQARAIAANSPHMLTLFGERVRDDLAIYEANGYEPNGEWIIMVRPSSAPVSLPGDERALRIEDKAIEDRVIAAIFEHGGTEHPVGTGHFADPAVFQYWMPVDGVPASFGRMVMLGDRSYLGEVMTFPPYRRQGHAATIVRRVLDDSVTAGAKDCMLVSTEMAHDLYLKMGFRDVTSVFGFETRPS